MKHPYSDILIAIAEGKDIQWNNDIHEWKDMDHKAAFKFLATDMPPKYLRIKPATITINGVECV